VVDGTLDVEVAPRAANQRFVVIAGDDTVEVRGTQFRVHRDARGTHVACRHGLVAVRDGAGELDVGAARQVDVPAGHRVADAKVAAMTPVELAELAQATPVTVPAGTGATTVELALEADAASIHGRPTGVAVRVDGVELGEAPMRVRVAPGRHLVEAADGTGRFHRVEWVTVEAGHPASVRVELALPGFGAPPPASAAADRRHQLLAGIDHARLGRCVRSIVRSGVAASGDLAVQIEIGVDAAGAVNFLNITDPGDLDAATTACVHDVLADVHFPAGGAASWHERVAL
jgi:ferric-dicitrate binding protein FerR (iron transport regulator)